MFARINRRNHTRRGNPVGHRRARRPTGNQENHASNVKKKRELQYEGKKRVAADGRKQAELLKH